MHSHSQTKIGHAQTQEVIDQWKHRESPDFDYYRKAEQESWFAGFWAEGSDFVRLFNQLDLTNVLEIACGQGRQSSKVIDRAGHLTLMDTSVDGLDACRARFMGRPNVSFMLSPTGTDLAGISDATMTAVFSYDSMVHFEMECIFAYLAETARVLKPGGRSLFHHSVFDQNPGKSFRDHPSWRNFMSISAFRHVSARAGLVIEEMVTFPWSTADVTDGLTLLHKPA